MSKSQHVMPSGGKWTLREAGSSRASRVFSSQQEAVDAAQKIAKQRGSVLYIHGKNGLIRERLSYTSDASVTKG
ncbi:hypothetical protein SAMN05880582_1011227 [Rhizobium sp. RU20A]|uniref:DUF2188 domain-containing protein n=1 Tax=Rhizobium sp. RU20A TaxID=1907412 RepID=UPI000955E827|nr:DUF2188 domain-containing protein [Rhizobium sp. RU20A]SIQ24509.1 hypothetical protein SAMN05880582_1011227 [Rhizobium sp. RU20A]